MAYKWCVVPQCTNTSIHSPQKLFVSVPTNPKRRKMWLELARRNPKGIKSHSNVFMCEDHFNMEKDTTNYMQYKMGFSQKILLADEAIPTKFHCQENCKRLLSNTGCPREVFLKKQRNGLATECLQSRNTTKNHAESLLKDDDMIQENKGEECNNKRCKETEQETGSYHTVPELRGKHNSPDDCTPTISKPNQTNSSHVSGGEVAVHRQEARVPLLHEEVLIKTENDPTCDIKCEQATDDYILGEPNSEVQHEDYMCCECNTNITGFRYVCVQCAEYDLCGACEAGGAHCSHYVLRVPGLRPHWEVRLVLEAVRQQLDAAVGPPPPPSLLESQVVPYDVDIKEEPKPDPLEDCIMHIDIEPSSPPPLTPAPSNHTKKDVRRPRISEGKPAASRNRSEASERIAITSSTTAVAVLGGSCVQVKEDVDGRVSIPGNRKSTRKRPAETSEDLSDTLQSAICKLEPNLSEPGGPNEDNCSGATFVTCGGLGEDTT